MERFDLLIAGGGAAGISAAKAANGSVLLVDRGQKPGGVLLQCAHRGFGVNQTGPEYVEELLKNFPETVKTRFDTTVLELRSDKTALLAGRSGQYEVAFDRCILAVGCREIPLGALPIAGTRPRGIYTAGDLQARMNLHDFVPEGPAVILGSGDLGLIMARQLAQAGISVTVIEKSGSCGGSPRNRVILEQYAIPLLCNTTIREVQGDPHLEAVILEKGQVLPCRTLLLAVGLVPDQSLAEDLGNPPWLTLCGNCRVVHPMVETAAADGAAAVP